MKWNEAPPAGNWQAAPAVRAPTRGNIPRAALAGASRGVLGTMDILPRGIAGVYNTLLGIGNPMGLQSWQGQPFAAMGALPERIMPGAGIGTYQPQTVPEERASFTGEMLGASVLPGAAMTPAGGLRALAGEMLAGGGAAAGGIASEAAGYGRMPGIVAGSLAPSAAAAATRRAILPTRVPVARERIAAARRQDVPISAGQAAGGSWAEKVVETLPGGTQAKAQMTGRQAERMGQRLEEITAGTPEPGVAAAGQQIRQGIDDWANRFRAEAGRLYDDVESVVPRDTQVNPTGLYDEVENLRGSGAFAGMTENPLVARLAARLDEIETAGTPVSYQDMRELRSMIGRQLSSPSIIADAPRAELKRLYGAITDDMRRTLEAVGGEDAITAAREADAFWRQGMERIDNILLPIQRRKTPEEAYKAAMSGSKEGASRLKEIRETLTDDQWDVVRRTVMRQLGEGRPSGAQFEGATEASMEFSPETFLTNLGRIHKDARDLLFVGSQDLDDLVSIASGARAQERYMYNPSGTARLLTNAVAPAAAVSAYFDPSALVPLARLVGGAYGTQRFLQSPMGLDWLTRPVSPLQQGLAGIAPRLSVGMGDQPFY